MIDFEGRIGTKVVTGLRNKSLVIRSLYRVATAMVREPTVSSWAEVDGKPAEGAGVGWGRFGLWSAVGSGAYRTIFLPRNAGLATKGSSFEGDEVEEDDDNAQWSGFTCHTPQLIGGMDRSPRSVGGKSENRTGSRVNKVQYAW